MTNKSALEELASRCEAATGPDRELDAAIARALGRAPVGLTEITFPRDPATERFAKYTASFDAAMSLMGKGWRKRAIEMDNGDCYFGIEVDDDSEEIGARAKTWALTATAAALRALAKEKGE